MLKRGKKGNKLKESKILKKEINERKNIYNKDH